MTNQDELIIFLNVKFFILFYVWVFQLKTLNVTDKDSLQVRNICYLSIRN